MLNSCKLYDKEKSLKPAGLDRITGRPLKALGKNIEMLSLGLAL